MRSLFWRILATFWLAITLVAVLAMLLGRALNQDAWIIGRHPAIKGLAADWVQTYEQRGSSAAQRLLEQQKHRFHIDTQVLSENGHPVIPGTFPPRAAAFEARKQYREEQLPWRRLTTEYTSPSSGETYLFIYRIPHPELNDWHRDSLLWPLSAIGIALIVLTGFSLLLTLSITRPLDRLRGAVHDLGQTSYQQTSLARLARRRDELGLLANDFNRMGARLQKLIGSQRQLLRDVSHELRSPLARLRIALALAERATPEERQSIWPRLGKECDRLETLIAEILELARMDAEPGTPTPVDLEEIFFQLQENARITAPGVQIMSQVQPDIDFLGWPDILERALDNLLRNALRFSPAQAEIRLSAQVESGQLILSVQDQGPGVDPAYLPHLSEPFYRAPGQTAAGHGLGLAIAQRAAERHGGKLALANHPEGGFIASLHLPLANEDKG
ncbi:HAMP domain-containing histidine kinase [Pseudomonas sp. ABC1]|uniref:sensor histidine kinase n=1 Tax=Pseudomonas sp. ABC1 TaxID=2748080 RepID=UPI0015C3FF65|nr:HAMP domain-containing sensor histidine kinase [Pseudomonas sp. ABC1]QLF92497.1 HAMP domain-containing histidine kinase [Pseudomonas sp. ABC1]